MRHVPRLLCLALATCLGATAPDRPSVLVQASAKAEGSNSEHAKKMAEWLRDHLHCVARPASKKEAEGFARTQGMPLFSTINTSFMRLVRWPAEKESITDTWNQPIPMIYSTAYLRDVLVGAHYFLSAAADGDSWNVNFRLPDNSSISLATPVTYHGNSSVGCWSGPWPTTCYQPPYTDVLWYLSAGSNASGDLNNFTPGQYAIDISYNGKVVLTTTFTLLPQLDPNSIPYYSQSNYSQLYGDTQQKTISRRGCALTDACMMLGYFGIIVDPPTLNTWMQTHQGYSNDNVQWPKVEEYAHSLGKNIKYINNASPDVFADIGKYGPFPVHISPQAIPPCRQHWMLFYGQVRNPDGVSRPGTDAWLVKDPNHNQYFTLPVVDYGTGCPPPPAGQPPVPWQGSPVLAVRAFRGPFSTFTDSTMGLSFTFHCPVELLLTDPTGRRVGVDPSTGATYSEIPGATYTSENGLNDDVTNDPDPEVTKQLEAYDIPDGTYTLTVTGTDTGTYTADFDSFNSGFTSSRFTVSTIPVLKGMVQKYTVGFAKATTTAFQVSGGLKSTYDGGGQNPLVNDFITYAYPTTAKTTLAAGATSVPVIIFYGSTTTANTFHADFNGSDVSAQFHPKPGSVELVTLLGLTKGSNLLKLSMDGSLPSGRVATDTDRLTFDVP